MSALKRVARRKQTRQMTVGVWLMLVTLSLLCLRFQVFSLAMTLSAIVAWTFGMAIGIIIMEVERGQRFAGPGDPGQQRRH